MAPGVASSSLLNIHKLCVLRRETVSNLRLNAKLRQLFKLVLTFWNQNLFPPPALKSESFTSKSSSFHAARSDFGSAEGGMCGYQDQTVTSLVRYCYYVFELCALNMLLERAHEQ
jgi:hypothetical protein